MNTNVETILWTYNEKKDNTYPVKTRVMWKGQSRCYKITLNGRAISLTKEGWAEINDLSNKLRGEKRMIRDAISLQEQKAKQSIITATANGQRPFSFIRFEEEFIPGKSRRASFFEIFDSLLQSLIEEGRVKTHNTYKHARTAFAKFLQDKDLSPIEITVQRLQAFDRFMVDGGASRDTIAMYMRTIRLVYNIAAGDQKYLEEAYPFARRSNDRTKYIIRKGTGKKGEALTKDQVLRFKESPVEKGTPMWKAKLVWLLSFYCQGMNFKDIAFLRPANVTDEAIVYQRQKTINTQKNSMPIIVPLNPNIRSLMEELNANFIEGDEYVFDIVLPSQSPMKTESTIQSKMKLINKHLRKLCKLNDLPVITLIWARPTYSTLLKAAGVDIEIIRDALGHSSILTTQLYLRRFELDKYRAANAFLDSL